MRGKCLPGFTPSLLGALVSACIAFAAPETALAQHVTVFSDDFQASAGLDSNNWFLVVGNYDGGSGTGFRSGTYDGRPDGFGSAFPSYSLYFRTGGGAARGAVMTPLDLSSYAAVEVTFQFRAEGSGGSTGLPFDGIDQDSEEIVLSYITSASSTLSSTALPTAGITTLWRSDFQTTYNWATITVTLPTGALNSDVAFMWIQSQNGSAADTWALDNITVTSIPEPGTWALFGGGAAGLAVVAGLRRRRRLSAPASRAP